MTLLLVLVCLKGVFRQTDKIGSKLRRIKMSVNYTSFAIIGIKVDSGKFTTIEKKRGCNCDVKNIEKMKFCPSCGAKVFITEETPLPQFDENPKNWKELPGPHTFCDYPVIYEGSYSEMAYIAALVVSDNQYSDKPDKSRMQIPKDINAIKETMKNTLGPIGLWDEKKFGIWAVLAVN